MTRVRLQERSRRGFAEQVDDRTDWRALVSQPAPELDLRAARERLLHRLQQTSGELPEGVAACSDGPLELIYADAQRAPPRRLQLRADAPICDELRGVRGQYLLFRGGALNLNRVRGYELELRRSSPRERVQQELF